MPLIGPEVVGGTLRTQDTGKVERRHAERYAGGTKGSAGIDRYRAAPEMVIPGHIPGVVHEEGAELGARERDVTRLNSDGGIPLVVAGDIPLRVIVEDVVVVDGRSCNRSS